MIRSRGSWQLNAAQEEFEGIASDPAAPGAVVVSAVGSGKTLMLALAPTARGVPADAAVALVPAALVKQTRAAFAEYAREFDIEPPAHVISHSILSTRGADAIPRGVKMLLVDEAHGFKDASSARSVALRAVARRDDPWVAVFSGTLVDRDLADAWFPLVLALRDEAPVPLDWPSRSSLELVTASKHRPGEYPQLADWQRWSREYGLNLSALMRLPVAERARRIREAWRKQRFEVSPWVVLTAQEVVRPWRYDPMRGVEPTEAVLAALDAVGGWSLPLGEWMDLATARAAAALTLSLGFYYPQGADAEALWVDDGETLRRIVALAPPGAILWYHHRAVADRLEAMGVEVYRAGQAAPTDGGRTVALSIRAHGTGTRLHRWAASVVLEPPAHPGAWEQLLGRTDRQGQEAAEMTLCVPTHTRPLADRMRDAYAQSVARGHLTGRAQKLTRAMR